MVITHFELHILDSGEADDRSCFVGNSKNDVAQAQDKLREVMDVDGGRKSVNAGSGIEGKVI